MNAAMREERNGASPNKTIVAGLLFLLVTFILTWDPFGGVILFLVGPVARLLLLVPPRLLFLLIPRPFVGLVLWYTLFLLQGWGFLLVLSGWGRLRQLGSHITRSQEHRSTPGTVARPRWSRIPLLGGSLVLGGYMILGTRIFFALGIPTGAGYGYWLEHGGSAVVTLISSLGWAGLAFVACGFLCALTGVGMTQRRKAA